MSENETNPSESTLSSFTEKIEWIHEPDAPIDSDDIDWEEAFEESEAEVEEDYKREIQLEQIEDMQQARNLRETYARRLFVLICIWISSVLVFVLFSKFLELSDAVLIALVSGSTANVLGLFYVVAKYLFPDGGARKK